MLRSLLLCFCIFSTPQLKAAQRLMLSHEQDPGSFIAVDVDSSGLERLYRFSFCQAPNTTQCSRIGRYESYREQQLLALSQSYKSTGYTVLGIELTLIAIGAASIAHMFFKNPALPSKIQTKVSEAAAPTHAAISKSVGYVATVLSWVYSGLIGAVFLHLKDEVISRAQSLVYLSIRFLSPADHLSAATIIRDLTNSSGSLHYTQREFASLQEYFFHPPLDNLQHLKRRIENILVVTPH